MRSLKSQLLSTTLIPAFIGAGMFIVTTTTASSSAQAATPTASSSQSNTLPTAKPRPRLIQIATGCNPCNPCAAKNPCNPCAAKNPCNPCAAKNPCNPCAAKNPCNPCAAKKSYSSSCYIPSLKKASPCNPCAAKNPCNPCAAKNPCNPCAAKNPCNPCADKNPCNPCAAEETPEINPAEAKAAYNCLKNDLAAGYAKSGFKPVAGYQSWDNVSTSPYLAGTHGGRYVNNYVNPLSAEQYMKYEEAGVFPKGTVLAKDSIVVKPNGKVVPGPLFIMEKMKAGFNKSSGDWRYVTIAPTGKINGMTNGKGMNMGFCAECHSSVAPDMDHTLLLPEEFRK